MKHSWKEWIEAGLEAGIILIILFLFCWPVRIEGISMEQSLFSGDQVGISRVLKWIGAYEPGDILVVTAWYDGSKRHIIKRMIADEGDQVLIFENQVFVNGHLLSEPYVQGETSGDLNLTVPEGCVFVLGDNREYSVDSRQLGVIEKEKISGKVILKWYPLNQIQFFD